MIPSSVVGFRPSPQQIDLVGLIDLDGPANPFRASCRLRIEGEVDPSSLLTGLRAMASRHEILRTALRRPPGVTEPLQVIADGVLCRLVTVDLSACSASWIERRAAEIERVASNYLKHPVGSAADEPSLEACWLAVAPSESELLIDLPSFRADAASVERIARGVVLPDAADDLVQYADVSEVFSRLLESDETRAGRAFWHEERPAGAPLVNLPGRRVEGGFEFSRIVGGTAHGVEVALSRAAAATRGDAEGLLVAAWAETIERHLGWRGGEGDLEVALTLDGRTFEGLEEAIGPFERTVPLALGSLADLAPREGAERAARAIGAAALHQDYWQFGETPVPAVGFVRRESTLEAGARGIAIRVGEVIGISCRFEIRLVSTRGPEGLYLAFEHDRSRYDTSEVERLAARLASLLDGCAELPDRCLGEQPVLTPEERETLLVGANRTARDLRACPLDALALDALGAAPDRIALESGGFQLSAAELARRVEDLSGRISALGLRRGSVVALRLDRSVEMVVSIVGALRAGAAYLPIDPELPAERAALMIADSGAEICVTSEAQDRILSLAVQGIAAIARIPAEPRRAGARSHGLDDLAYVIYTSGSTGRPKGVMVAHGAIANRLLWMQRTWPLEAGDRLLQKTTFSFDASIWEIFGPLIAGARLVLAAPGAQRDPEELRSAIEEQGITVLQLVPSMLGPFLDLPGIERCTSLRRLFAGGEALGADMVAKVEERLPAAASFNLYGPTEAAIDACARQNRPGERPAATMPIGRPIANLRAYLLDRRGQPVPPGVAGELHLGGAGLARGYAGRPDLSSERFVPDAVSGLSGERLYRTGDLAAWITTNEGPELKHRSRIDHQVKIRGFRIELGEIEAVLLRQPGVERAAVVVRAGADGALRLVAFYSATQGALTPGAEDLRAALGRELPEYMVPAHLVPLVDLPTNAAGKLDRLALPEDVSVSGASGAYEAPRHPIERTLCALWAEALRIERVGIRDNFFRLGGDSILSIQIVARAARAGVRITPRQLFLHQTVAELSAVAAPIEETASVRRFHGGTLPLTPIQRYFFEQGLAEPHHYNQVIFLASAEPLSPRALSAAAAALVAVHGSFRLRFERGSDGWCQTELAAADRAAFSSIDQTALSIGRRSAETERTAARVQEGFDLGRPPLLRVVLFCGGAAGDRLLIAAHHLAIDGVSWGIVLGDLEAAYSQALRGESVELPPVPVTFADWALHSAEFAAPAERAVAWLEGIWTESLPLPRAFPVGAANLAGLSETVNFLLDAEATEALLAAGSVLRAQLVELLLAALASAASSVLGSRVLLVDLEGHGRDGESDDLDLSRTVGWLTAIHPVALQPALEIGASIRAIKEQLRSLAPRGVEYGRLRYLGDADAAARLVEMPRAEVSFNFLGQADRTLPSIASFSGARESAGPSRSPRQERRYLLEIDGGLRGGRLSLNFAFAQALGKDAVSALVRRFESDLRRFAAEAHAAQPASLSPTDFPLAKVASSLLADLVAKGRAIEDLLPLTPLQSGLLFHALDASWSDLYLVQWSCDLSGDLDVPALRAAWATVSIRHAALRTAFAGSGLDVPVQVVYSVTDPEWREEDWRGLAAVEQRQRLATLLAADRARGFDPTAAPLLRFALVRLADDRWRFLWSHHHLILDGWCLPVVLGEVFSDYQRRAEGKDIELPPVRPFRDFLAWLGRRDPVRAEEYWREALADFRTPLSFPRVGTDPAVSAATAGELGASLSEETTARAVRLARERGLTLNTLSQGAYAIVLGRATGIPDVVFGATVSGRPPEVPGVESMVGLFINTLPVRARWTTETEILPWLLTLQAEQVVARQFEQVAPIRLQQLVELPRGASLFDAIMTFENFPVDRAVIERLDRPGRLRVVDIRQEGRNSNPLTLLVGPDRRLSFHFLYDRSRLAEPAVRRYLGELMAVFEILVERPDSTLGELEAQLDARQERLREQEGESLNRALRDRLRGRIKRERAT